MIFLSGVILLLFAPFLIFLYRKNQAAQWRSGGKPLKQSDKTLLDQINDAVVAVDSEWVILDCNPAFTSLLGYTPDELNGKHFRFLYAEGEAGAPEADFPKRGTLEVIRYRKKSGEAFSGETSFSLIQESDRRLNRIVALIRNHPPRPESESDVRRLNKTLERRVIDRMAQLHAMNLDLQVEINQRKRVESHLAAEHAITRILAESGTLVEAAPRILQVLCESLAWDLGLFWKTNDQVCVLTCIETWRPAAAGLSKFEAISREKIFWPDEGLPGRVWSEGEPIWLTGVTEAAGFVRMVQAAEAGFYSALAFPIRSGEGVAGVMEFFSREVRRSDHELLEILSNIGSQIGQFIDRKESEKALRESETRKRAIMESALDCMITVDHEGRIIEFNPAAERTFGYSRGELLGQNLAERIIPPHLRKRHRDAFAKYLETGAGPVLNQRIETTGMRADGSEFPVELTIMRIPLEGPAVFQGFLRDITERKQAEEALAAEKERLAVTLGSIGDGVIATDVTGRVIFINRTAEELSGWFRAEAIGRPLPEVFRIVHEKSRAHCENPVEKVLATGNVVALANHTVLIAKDGKEHAIADSGAPIRNREGEVIGVVLVFRDVTEKQRMEEELLRASTLESVGLLAGGVAHDFNNILTAILGNVSLAMLSLDERSEPYERLAQAEKASMRARDLAQQLLTFAKGGVPVKKTASLVDLLRDASDFVTRGSNVRCAFSIQEGLWPVEIDEGQIGQVIHNLVLNAQQAMPEGGTIEIRAVNKTAGEVKGLPLHEGNYVHIAVRDFGIGIPKDHLAKIFDPYFTTKRKGSGLGLSISYSIVKKHDGHMTVDSEPGKGATFSLYLPAFPKAALPKGKETAEVESLTGRGRILVMDDEESIRDVLDKLLRRLGYEALLAEDGAEAISLYRQAIESETPIDAVIMDLTVPGGMGGKEAILALREIDPEIKAIVSSGYSNDPMAAAFMEYGFSEFIAKPFKLENLGKVLKRVIPRDR
ncbi:PAS domain S-box protein [Candidatus Manganitrophus noduliformans]|nr:PAS domain S-box protein [Candidatus Manganitrophus noduliformans]